MNKEQPTVIVTCARNAHQPDLSFVASAALQNGRRALKLVSLESLLRRITFCAQRSSNVRQAFDLAERGGHFNGG